ncbi:MAG: cyclopropane fatty acyl phospholipid synthase [Bacteroidales bacterium]|jgi:cyclopropane-fatty-acyl-phospholipid synthase|nr:cyclopropane fatty acyl phospholipid synthase [Bacteroidales bacterium]
MKNTYKKTAEEILTHADVKINGNRPWDIQVYNDKFYERAVAEGELGMGESYMDGWWDAEQIDEMICRILRAHYEKRIPRKLSVLTGIFLAKIFNMQSKRRATIIAEKHYDLGNDLFQHMLDERMNYSCAYWKGAESLKEAQEKKLDLICNKLYLQPGMRILDIGCGWGAFGKYAAEKYKAEVVGITVSKQQVDLGRKLCEGLPVEFRLMDYRNIHEKFDRIVSVGMIEHVGNKNYRTFFKVANKCLHDNGLFLLQTIGSIQSLTKINPWTDKYIFPNGLLPSVAQLGKAVENLFIIEDWHNFGADYDKTLMVWYHNFEKNWERIKHKYPGRFYKMWKYYLLSSAGSFRARSIQLWQVVLSKTGVLEGYQSVR